MSTAHLRLAAALCGLLATQCNLNPMAGGAGVGNPPLADVAVAFQAGSLAKARAGIPGPGGAFTIYDYSGAVFTLTSIDVVVSRIAFALPAGVECGNAEGVGCQNGTATVNGLFRMDLMTGKSNPALGRIRLPEALYKKVEVGFQDSTFANLIVNGYTDSLDGPVRRFALKLDLRYGLVFEKWDGLQLDRDSLNTILMRLTVDGWLDGVGLAKCLESPEISPDSLGVLNLDGDGFCGSQGLLIRRNIEISGEIGFKPGL